MAFIKSSLSFAERFLDVLDDKGEIGAKSKAIDGQSGDKPAFTRRSASFATQQAEVSDGPPSSPGLSRRSAPGVSHHISNEGIHPENALAEASQAVAGVSDRPVSASEDDGRVPSIPVAAVARRDVDSGHSSDIHEHIITRRSRRESSASDSEGTVSALLAAIQEKDARIVQLTMQNETYKRQNGDLSADLDDMEVELRRAQDEAEKAKKSVHGLEQQVKDAYAETAAARVKIETLQSQLERCDPTFATKLSQQADALQTETESLKNQLARAELARSQLQDQMTALRTAAQRREDELMQENQELAKELAAAEVAAMAQSAHTPGSTPHSLASMEAELEAQIRRDAAAAAEAAMLAERKLSLDRLRQLEQASQQLNVAHESLDKTKAELIAVRAERDATVSRLKAEIAAVSNQLKDNRTSQLETRLATLADSLVEKQGTIDQLISEKSAMSQRLELERQRRRVAEEALTSWQQKQAPGGDYDMDLEEGTPTRGPSTRARHRGGSAIVPISRIEAVAKNPTVAQAADNVDKFCLRTGRFLGVNPYARLVFFVYLVLLHLWAMFILSFHTHQLDTSAPTGNRDVIVTPGGQVLQS